MWHACDMPSLPSMVPHSWYLERGDWKSVLKSGYLHVLATNPKRYQEIKMHWCMMHGNYKPHSSSWTLGCPLVWSYFYVTIRVKRYGWIMLNVQSKLTNLRMDCHHFCIFPWDFHGFSDFPLPWSGTAIFPGRLPWTKGPKTRWIHGESTVNPRWIDVQI